jgi:hypothetical protein
VRTYSTKEAAKAAGIHWITLHRWMVARKVSPSQQIGMDGGKHWRWTEGDIERVKKHKAKHFREGQGRRTKRLSKAK